MMSGIGTATVAGRGLAAWAGVMLVCVLGGLLGVAGGGCVAPGAASGTDGMVERPYRGIWVTRWDYRTENDVRRIMREVSETGFTDVIWQVRGQADAFYRSDLEPWGEELFRDLPSDARDPGFDPLAVAVEAAHERGLRIHAWVNVMPLWRGEEPPKSTRHLFHRRSEWRLRDRAGEAQPLTSHYVIVNPVFDEVHDHIVTVCRDIVRRYRVDGLHLDYVRFVADRMDGDRVYPGDRRSIAMFRQATGRPGIDRLEDREAYRAWIRDRITELVRRIRWEAATQRGGVELSAAVWRRPELAHGEQLQDAVNWIERGLIHRAMPMIYSDDDERYFDDLSAWYEAAPARRMTPGIGTYRHSPGQSPLQVGLSGRANGFALFAYAAMYESVDPNQDKSDREVRLRQQRRDAVQILIRRLDRAEDGD